MASNSSYYIYIKNVKQENKKTTPKAPSDYGGDSDKGNGGTKPTPPNEGGGKRVPSFVPYSSQLNSVGRLFSSGTSAFVKASISIAILTKTLQIAEQTTTAINNYVSVQTGDYSSKLKWDNLDRGIKNVIHPISSSINAFLTQEAWERSNMAKDEQRTLLGDTQINTLTKGV